MNKISQILLEKRKKYSCTLIPFLTAGYPDIDTTIRAVNLLDDQGADIIELGIPYADALADGPVIQNSSKVAIEQGVYIDQVLNILKVIQSVKSSIVIFTYYNPILVKGIDDFIFNIAQCSVKGLLIPDLPLEEIDYILSVCKKYDIELILFIAPTSSKERMRAILNKSLGCIYLVSSTGVTGSRRFIDSNINKLSNYIRSSTDKCIMLGFGISQPHQVTEIANWNIDGIVMGTSIIQAISQDKKLSYLSSYYKSMQNALD